MNKTIINSLKVLIFAVFIFSLVPSTRAQNICNPPQAWFESIQDSFDRNIRETTVNHLTSALSDWTWAVVTGTEMSEYMNCSSYVSQYLGPEIEAQMNEWGCSATDVATCQNIVNQFADAGGNYDPKKFASSKIAGSLLGMTYMVQNTLNYTPVPTNMAYFFRDYGGRLPIIGEKVLAADTTDYRHTLINSVLDLWKITRNIAYGLMAIIMLYVGFTIIARKRISQQVVVTVQYAIPKVALSLIMIAFSYPIGAFLTSLSWSLFYSVPSIIEGIAVGDASGSVQMNIGVILAAVIGSILASGGGAVAVGIVVVIAGILLVGFNLFVQFKALMLFIKMVLSIVTAPLEFALSAIPGNDNKLADWFKRMFATGLGIVALQGTVVLVHMFGEILINESLSNNILAGYLYATFGVFFIFLFGYGYAIKMPSKIEAAIMGPPKKPSR